MLDSRVEYPRGWATDSAPCTLTVVADAVHCPIALSTESPSFQITSALNPTPPRHPDTRYPFITSLP